MKILVLLGFIFSVQTACQNTLSFPETKDSVELMYCDSNMIIQRDQSIEESISWFQNNRELPEDTVDNRIDGYVQRNQDWFALLDQKEKGSEFSPFDANGKIYIERVIKAGEVDTNGEKYKVDTRVVTSCGINLLDGEEYAVTSSHCLTDAGYKQGDDLVDDVDNKLRASRYKISFGFGRESKEYNGKKLVEGPKGWQHLEDRPQYKHFRDIQSGDKECSECMNVVSLLTGKEGDLALIKLPKSFSDRLKRNRAKGLEVYNELKTTDKRNYTDRAILAAGYPELVEVRYKEIITNAQSFETVGQDDVAVTKIISRGTKQLVTYSDYGFGGSHKENFLGHHRGGAPGDSGSMLVMSDENKLKLAGVLATGLSDQQSGRTSYTEHSVIAREVQKEANRRGITIGGIAPEAKKLESK